MRASVQNARAAAESRGGRVALDIGPLGELLEPAGTLSFEEAYEIFAEIVRAGRGSGRGPRGDRDNDRPV